MSAESLIVMYWTLYTFVLAGLCVAAIVYVVLPVAAFARLLFASEKGLKENYIVTHQQPLFEKKNGKLGVLREVKPLMMMVVAKRGGSWVYPVVQESGHRYTVRGLQEGDLGMQSSSERDWDILKVAPDPRTELKPLIQPEREGLIGTFGAVLVYRYRKWVNTYVTGLQVVRLHLFLLWGRVVFEPVTHRYVRARPKGAKYYSETMEYLDRREGEQAADNLAEVEMVVDTSDHVLVVFPLRFLGSTFPVGKSAYSFRADVTLSLEVMNLLRLLSFPDWSSQLLAGVNDACAKYFRSGTLESVYALKEGASSDVLQELIRDHVTDSNIKEMGSGRCLKFEGSSLKEEGVGKWGICQALGLHLHNVTLNDLVPADKVTEKAVTELMSGVMRGEIAAKVAGLLTQEQLHAIQDATSEQLEGMARQTAASQLGSAKHVDWFNFAGAQPGGDANSALLAALIRAVRNTGGEV